MYANSSLVYADAPTRIGYLKKVSALTFLGLSVSAIVGVMSAIVIANLPFLHGRWASLALVLGSFGIANYLAPRFVFSEAKWFGFGLGVVFQGVAMGYILLAAVSVGVATGSPFLLIGQALLLTALTAVGITGYLWSNPKEFKLLGAAMAALTLPMLALMAISFIFPIGGTAGLLLSGAFVVVSTAGLLYQINQVLHKLNVNMHVEGAYMVTMGILILFWNLLSLLMRLRD